MFVKGLILLFLIVFLTFTPLTAQEEPLDINIEFRKFYEVNISGASAKNIGVAGLGHYPTIYVNSTSKEVDLTNRILEVTFNYEGNNTRNLPIFGYEGHFDRNVTFPIYFSLADELNNGERSCFQFEILLVKPGSYWVEWFEIVDGKRIEGSGMRIQIIEPYEWENIIKQANLIEAETKSAEASKNISKWTMGLAIAAAVSAGVTAILAGSTFWMAWVSRQNVDVSRRTLEQIKKDSIYEVLSKLQMEYRSPQMLYALNRLWNFYEKCKNEIEKEIGYKEETIEGENEKKEFQNKVEKRLKEKYRIEYRKEKKELLDREKHYKIHKKEKPIEYLENTLDHQRRLVSHFYNHLAALHVNGVIEIDIILQIWSKDDLRTIKEIIIPLDEVVHEEGRYKEKQNLSILRELWEDVASL